ncbi:MAG TPA: hypothetical protein VHQ47_17940 [Phycisphaerae bacterium]|jgi:hypothetical protein|nr:hypothetical protein [Phycisphaerae bacterium]
MAITFSEKSISGNIAGGGQNSYGINALGHATSGETATDVFNAACADTTTFPINVSVTLPGGSAVTFIRETISVDPAFDEGDDPTWFEVKVPYVILGGSQQPYAEGDTKFSFSIGTQSINIKQSKATSNKYSTLGGGAPDLKQCINVTPQGDVQGVDLDFPTYTWTETHYLPASMITDAYKAALYNAMSNPVCNASFRGCAAYEAKILGVEGTERHKEGDWEVNFRFAGSPNFTGLTVGAISGIAKKGWEYLWVYYEETTATVGSNKVRIVQPRDVYVEKVYGDFDPSTLGIGTT